ncbi:FG-GAP-like repeat-containing protein [Telmatobacter sp. DSM 110680]|uniref:FG-GAP-like repeat-containing protein n=1 Tax=Telmatobacter sp. DSM 110680 TaxID=3036704 RepID=A0AAU7DJG2_9BACT
MAPGSDQYVTEKYAFEIESAFRRWSETLKNSPHDHSVLTECTEEAIQTGSFSNVKETKVRSSFGIDVVKRKFDDTPVTGRKNLLKEVDAWLGPLTKVETAEFEIFGIEQISSAPLTVRVDVRYDLVAQRSDDRREERVGSWRMVWLRDASQSWKALRWEAGEETQGSVRGLAFVDVTTPALGHAESYTKQLAHGADYWRTVLDGAIGVDVYGNNGVAAGDFDNDGFDDLYVCQPAGLPNRLYRNRGDGTFEDVTQRAGVGVLDNTACALFADFDNKGVQDLLVVCGTGPLLFRNQGDGTFALKRDAFKFARQPQGTFTHAAIADYDRDGRLDIYFCMYMYYLGLDQYHYPIPYYDARNGPPNCLFHNEGNGNFVETTDAAGLNADNDRYSFACAWGDSNSNGQPDLFVANDFGSSQLYRNNGDGTFTVVSSQAHVEGVGAGMSCCWADFDNDGRQDIYVPSMWEAAGQRVSGQKQFHESAPERIRELYQRHARGNALYRNKGDGTFENVGKHAAVEMGRWSWSSDFWDIDHDGYVDLYVANGYLSGTERNDLASFFWRQVVAKSSEDSTPAPAYEHGWQAINELVRSDNTWHGYARNVMLANNRDGTFTEISGLVGLDFLDDSRAFALADIDHDGRLEVILKNRNAPQIRILHNALTEIGDSISFRLRGYKSNSDAIGAAVTVETGTLRTTKYLQAGSGFLSQHSKELFFGVGKPDGPIRATVRWPNGESQQFEELPLNHCIEIIEGQSKFGTRLFSKTPAIYERTGEVPLAESLPLQVETWLIEPLKAPGFALPDLAGKILDLNSLQGGLVLLIFWATTAPVSLEQLEHLREHRTTTAANRFSIVGLNVDPADEKEKARAFATRGQFSFPILFAGDEVAGIYNVIYRHLFDRRRNLPLPAAFLLDQQGMIVKAYQGPMNLEHLQSDLNSVPTSTASRMEKALPFKGILVQDAFQRNDFTYGVAMYQHGYLEQAAESFRQVLLTKPGNADAYYNLGTLSLRKNDFKQARQYLEKTIELRPNHPESWNNLGMMAAQQGLLDEAIRDFQKSLQLRPEYAIALLNLGNVYRRQRSFENAQECLGRALQLQPEDPETNYSMGMLYAQQSDVPHASQFLLKALELRPGYPEALNNLGVLYVHTEKYVEAEDQFKTAIRVAPAFDQSYLNLARLYALRNEKEQARNVLLNLLRVQPENTSAKQALELLQ